MQTIPAADPPGSPRTGPGHDVVIRSAVELAADLERRILAGELADGARLDPVREAANRLELAPNTVASAYRILAERGLVVGRGRLGTFVHHFARLSAQVVPDIPVGAIDLASGVPDPELLPDLAPHLSALGGSDTTYGDPSVSAALATAAGELLANDSIPVTHLAATGGAVDGIERAIAAGTRPGDTVAVEDPGWFVIADLIRALGRIPVPVPVDRHGMTATGLSEVAGSVAAVVLTPRAQNPTGAVVTVERAADLLAVLEPHPHLLVVEDDHMGPVSGGDLASLAGSIPRWVHVRSFAKALGPDLRVAVVAGDGLTMDRLIGRQMLGTGWVSHILQRTVARLLRSSDVEALSRRAASAYTERRRALVDALADAGMPARGRTGLNVWVDTADEDAVVDAALSAGYAIRAGRRFRHDSPPGVRVTAACLPADQAPAVAAAMAEPPRLRRSRAV